MQRRILIVRPDRVGDVVMITPAIREIRRTFPDSYIAALTRENTSAVLKENPHIDKIITDPLTKGSFFNIIKQLKEENFTDALLMIPNERAAYQLFFAGIPNRIGVGRKFYQRITGMKSVSRNKYIPLRHEADYCMDLARQIGVVSNNLKPEIYLSEEEKTEGKRLLSELGINDKKFIIIHTGSKSSDPNWNEGNYYVLLLQLIEKYKGLKILLTALEMSEEFRIRISGLNQKNIIAADKKLQDLRDLIKVISHSKLLISGSTGPMHIASALGVNTVSVFCHRTMSRPARWGALGDKAHNIEVRAEFCDNRCSLDKEVCFINEGITKEMVMQEAEKIIN